MAMKEAKDFFKEGWAEELGRTMLTQVLMEVEVHMEPELMLAEGRILWGRLRGECNESCGGGGGSYNTARNQQNECCYNIAGRGQVTITLI